MSSCALAVLQNEKPCWDRYMEHIRRRLMAAFASYRPELHYMRGPGSKWREKHVSVRSLFECTGAIIVRCSQFSYKARGGRRECRPFVSHDGSKPSASGSAFEAYQDLCAACFRQQVYAKEVADALEADLQSLVGGALVTRMSKHDTNPANSLQCPGSAPVRQN
jgi:hypothetical protein